MKFVRIKLVVLPVFAFTFSLSAQTAAELLIKSENSENPEQSKVLAQQALDIATKSNDINNIASSKAIIASCNFFQNKLEEGEASLKEAFQLANSISDPLVQLRCWNSKGVFYYFKQEIENCKNCFEKAYGFSQKVSDTYYSRDVLLSLAECNYLLTKPEAAIENCKQALKISESQRSPIQQAKIYYKLGVLFNTYTYYDKAIENLLTAQKIFEKYESKYNSALCFRKISENYAFLGQYQSSLDYIQKAIPLFKEINNSEELISCYFILSRAYMWIKNFAEADKIAEQALNMARGISNKYILAQAILNKSQVNLNVYNPKTLEQLKEGYSIAKELVDENLITLYENWIGLYFDINKNYTEALPFYTQIVERNESSIKKVPEEYKIQYWSSNYINYTNLIDCQLSMKDYTGCINSIEKSTARMLMERITKKEKREVTIPDVKDFSKNISANQIVIYYANLAGNILTVTNSAVEGISVNDGMWAESVKNRYAIPEIESLDKLRAFKKIHTKQPDNQKSNEPSQEEQLYNVTKTTIEKIANNYRLLLSNPTKSQTDKETLEFLGKKFYQLLIKPIESKLEGKTELLIIPTDIFAFLPFEAFIMPDGRYLVEKYDIHYLPSYSVGSELAERKYSDSRKPMLALGNAVYDVTNVQTTSNLPQSEFNELMKGVEESVKKGENMKRYYNALNYSWANLPGTQAELDAISGLVPTATLIKGKEVSKQNLLQMAQKGLLKNYKMIHFATHGVVIPEFQDLSAIVLTQGLPNDDGYLRASEVANLNINADFVNLSACETGLGRIYEGEGVVGLTQAFLLAGANSLAVSLWQVSDQSTMEFQKEFYRLVFVEKMPISKAINQVKRTFIKGQYNQPFYWAPFVYYGM